MRRSGAAAASARSARAAASSSRAAASCGPASATCRGYGYGRGYGRGWGVPAAVGLGVLGAAAVGAAAYGYSDPCVQQQQVYDMYGNVVLAARARLLSRRRPPDTRKARGTGPFPFCPQLSSLPRI